MTSAHGHRVPVRAGRAGQQGLGLLEMLLVLALAAGVAALTAAAIGQGGEGRQLRAAVRELSSALREARARALVEGRVQQVRIDPAARTWEGAGGRHGTLPEGLRVRFTGAAQLQPAPGVGVIAFHPDGGASGGRIELQGRRAGWRLDVAWLTGQVEGRPLEVRR